MKKIVATTGSPSTCRYQGHALASQFIVPLLSPQPAGAVASKPDGAVLTEIQKLQLKTDIEAHIEELQNASGAIERIPPIGPFTAFARGNHAIIFTHREMGPVLIKIKSADFVANEHRRYQHVAQIVREQRLAIDIPKTDVIDIAGGATSSGPVSALIQDKMALIDRDDETKETIAVVLGILNGEHPSLLTIEEKGQVRQILNQMIGDAARFVLKTGMCDLGPNFPRLTETGRLAGFDFEGLTTDEIPVTQGNIQSQIENLTRLGGLFCDEDAHRIIAHEFGMWFENGTPSDTAHVDWGKTLDKNLQTRLAGQLETKNKMDLIRRLYLARGTFEPMPVPYKEVPPPHLREMVEKVYTVLSNRPVRRYSVQDRRTYVSPPTIVDPERQKFLDSLGIKLDIPGLIVVPQDNRSEAEVRGQFIDAIEWLKTQNTVLFYQDNNANIEIYY